MIVKITTKFSIANFKLTSHETSYYVQSVDLLINLLILFSIDYVHIHFFSISYSVD